MASFSLAYARALAAVAADGKADPARIEEQLREFQALLGDSKDLREILLNPTLSTKKRVAVLEAVCGRLGTARQATNFLAVLIEHERLGALIEIVDRFRVEMNQRLGISEVEVLSVRLLDAQERASLTDYAAKLAGTQIRTSFRQDSSLIGGVILRIGSKVYDGSVRGRLDRLKDRLLAD